MTERFLELLYPSSLYCLCCGKYTDGSRSYSLCDHCISRMDFAMREFVLPVGGEAAGRQRDEAGRAAAAAGQTDEDGRAAAAGGGIGLSAMGYGLYERQLIFALKYSGKTYVARHIAAILFDCLKKRLAESGNCPWLRADVIVPVPLHAERQRLRGFNQAERIAFHLSRQTGIPLADGVLLRVRNTRPQRALSAEERKYNMEGAFALSEQRAAAIIGKRVLLIDDIFTTGATAAACAEALRKGGAARVDFLALAAAGRSGKNCADQVPPLE